MVSTWEARKACLEFSEKLNHQAPIDFAVREAWKDIYGVEGTAAGGFHSARDAESRALVTIAASSHRNVEAINRTLQHEIFGHWMINTYSPEKKRDLLVSIINSKTNESLRSAWEHVEKYYPDSPEAIKAEEVWSFVAENVNMNSAATIDLSRLRVGTDGLGISDLETMIASRVEKLRSGRLLQQTFPENDVHETVSDLVSAKRITEEWKARQETATIEKAKPSLTLVQ